MSGTELEMIKIGINAGSLGLNFLIIVLLYRFIDRHTPVALAIFREAVNKTKQPQEEVPTEKGKKT